MASGFKVLRLGFRVLGSVAGAPGRKNLLARNGSRCGACGEKTSSFEPRKDPTAVCSILLWSGLARTRPYEIQ